MQIGPYTLKNRLVVAPMAGVTDRPFRVLCKRMGAGMAVGEMLASNTALWSTKKSLRRADHRGKHLFRNAPRHGRHRRDGPAGRGGGIEARHGGCQFIGQAFLRPVLRNRSRVGRAAAHEPSSQIRA